MKTPHKHHDLIVAWAAGAEIELMRKHSHPIGGWVLIEQPDWDIDSEYRIKPEPKPDVVKYCEVDSEDFGEMTLSMWVRDNLKLTFHGETGKLLKAEVI